jgi:hypothetical protein
MKEDKENKNRFPFEILIPAAFVAGILYFVLSNLDSTSKNTTFILRPLKQFR